MTEGLVVFPRCLLATGKRQSMKVHIPKTPPIMVYAFWPPEALFPIKAPRDTNPIKIKSNEAEKQAHSLTESSWARAREGLGVVEEVENDVRIKIFLSWN